MQDRILKIKDYFLGLEICDDIVFGKVDYPGKWVIPSDEVLNDMFNVKVVENNKGVGFFYCCEINDGVTPIFDAIDFTIDFNKTLEEKSNLLLEKVNELKTLFAEKPIEVLRTIEFKYTEKKTKSRKNKKEEKENTSTNEVVLETQVEDNNDYSNIEVKNNTASTEVKTIIETDSLMEYALKYAGE